MDDSAFSYRNLDAVLTCQSGSAEYGLEDVVKFVENKVIGADGLTLAEVFQALVQMLDGDLELVKEVLACTNTIAEYGMNVAKESQLSRSNLLRALVEGKENVVSSQDFIKKSPSTRAAEHFKKKSRGLY